MATDTATTPAAIERLIVEHLRSSRHDAAIEATTPFIRLGLDSLEVIILAGELEAELGLQLDPSQFFAHPSPRQLAISLAAVAA